MYNWIIGSVLLAAALALFYLMYGRRKPIEKSFESVAELLEKSFTNGDISVEEYVELKEMLKKPKR